MLDYRRLASIGDLELVARVIVDGAVSGLHRSPFHGYSAEFSQYRHYRPGDDLKYVDWKLFARTDRFYTKQYRETTNMLAQVALDGSASMAFCGRTGIAKFDYARILAAALAHLVARQGDAIGLAVYGDGLRQYIPSKSGQPHLRSVLMALARQSAAGATSAASALRRAADLLRRRGLLTVISDLYDEDAHVESELRRATRIGHDVAVFHVLTRDEVDFPYSNDVELEDLESGRRLIAGGEASGYQERFAAFLERWRRRCAQYGIDYVRVFTDIPVDVALRAYLLKRSRAPR